MQLTGRPNTVKVKTCLFNKNVKPHLHPDGSNLNEAIQLWEHKLKLSPSTIRALLYLAKQYVEDSSGVVLNITPEVKRLNRSKQQVVVKALTAKETKILLDYCKQNDPKLYFPVAIAMYTGLRRGEVWGLKWQDVNFNKKQILIARSYDGPTKNGRSRIVPLAKPLEDLLLVRKRNNSYNCSGDQRIVNNLFDPNPRLKKACKRAGVRIINFHCLRHSFATLALEARRSPALVSKTLGHSNISTTLDLYWSSLDENLNLEFLPNG